MKDRRNGIIQLAILVTLGAAVLLSLAAPDLEGRDRGREPVEVSVVCLLYTSPSPRDPKTSRMPSSA